MKNKLLIGTAAALTACGAAVCFFTKPNNKRKDQWLRFTSGTYFAHRGLFDNETDAPENSLKAFQKAVDNGYGIELDVQLTKDNLLVVHHDLDLKRSCGVNKILTECTYDELQQYNLFKSEEKIPLFTEVLKIIDGKVPLIVEIKVGKEYKGNVQKLSWIMRDYKGPYVVESFDPRPVHWYRVHHPEIIRGQLAEDYYATGAKLNPVLKFMLTNYWGNFYTRPDFMADNIEYCKRPGYQFMRRFWKANSVTWTVQNEEQEATGLKNFDGVIFDSYRPR